MIDFACLDNPQAKNTSYQLSIISYLFLAISEQSLIFAGEQYILRFMEIILSKDSLNFEYNSDEELLDKLRIAYTIEGYTPDIRIGGGKNLIQIIIDDAAFKSTRRDFERAMNFCNRQDFANAEPILHKVIQTSG